MDRLSTLFAWTVAVLAGLVVLGALAYALVWEVCRIRWTLAAHRTTTTVPPFDPSTRYWPEHSAVKVVDGITDQERDQVRQMAGRVLAGDSLRDIAKERRP